MKRKLKNIRKIKDVNFERSLIVTLSFILLVNIIYFSKNFIYSKEDILNNANHYYMENKYFQSARYFAKAIEIGVANNEDYRTYANVLIKIGNYKEALKVLKQSLNKEPNNAETYFLIGDTYYQRAVAIKNYTDCVKAIESLEKAVEINPYLEKAYLLAGTVYRMSGMQNDARGVYRKAILTGNFSNVGFNNLIGHTFSEEGRYKEAISYYERAIKNDSNFAASYCYLGDMYVELGDMQLAIEQYNKAKEINADYIVSYIKLADIYIELGQNINVILLCEAALNINPENPQANYFIGKAYSNLKQKNTAVEYFKKAAYYGSDKAIDELINIGIDLR